VPQTISLIIPTLNAAVSLPTALQQSGEAEWIVADGGSDDNSCAIARRHGALLIQSRLGRGTQLNAGAAAARGELFVFLHADTRLPPNWDEIVRRLPPGHLGAFRFRVDARGLRFRLLELAVALRCRLLRLPFGDQCFVCWRQDFPGFADIPLMEDVDLVKRMRRVHFFPAAATTSARRWVEDGLLRRSLRNLRTYWRYRRGVPPEQLVAFYENIMP